MRLFQPFDPEAIYTPEEVEAETLFSRKTLAKWRWLGAGPQYRKLNGRVFYLGRDLNLWLASAERGGTPAPEAA